MKRFIFLTLVVILTSCSTHIIPFTKDKPVPYQGPVAVYRSESEAPASYKVVSALTHYDWGKYRRLSLEDVIPILQENARSQGADGIIIDGCEIVYSGIFSRGIDVKGRAIITR